MYAGPMFRAERPQKGRYRQFNQVGIECLGADDPTIDAEAIVMLMRFYAKMGVQAGAMRLLVNSMGCSRGAALPTAMPFAPTWSSTRASFARTAAAAWARTRCAPSTARCRDARRSWSTRPR